MNRNEIITALYTSKEIADALAKVDPQHLQEDLRQEVFMVLCEMPEARLQEIYASWNNNGLRYYTIKTLWRMVTTTSAVHPFVKNFKQKFYTDLDVWDAESGSYVSTLDVLSSKLADEFNEDELATREAVAIAFNELPMYNREILKLYVSNDFSTIQTGKDTGINQRSIRYNLAKTRQILKRRIEEIKSSNIIQSIRDEQENTI